MIKRRHEFICDHEGCGWCSIYNDLSYNDAFSKARSAGWLLDYPSAYCAYCPDHRHLHIRNTVQVTAYEVDVLANYVNKHRPTLSEHQLTVIEALLKRMRGAVTP